MLLPLPLPHCTALHCTELLSRNMSRNNLKPQDLAWAPEGGIDTRSTTRERHATDGEDNVSMLHSPRSACMHKIGDKRAPCKWDRKHSQSNEDVFSRANVLHPCNPSAVRPPSFLLVGSNQSINQSSWRDKRIPSSGPWPTGANKLHCNGQGLP